MYYIYYICIHIKVITVTPVNEKGTHVVGCSSAAIVAVARAAPSGSDLSGTSAGSLPSHPTSKTQAIITAEDASSPGINIYQFFLYPSFDSMMSYFSSTDNSE